MSNRESNRGTDKNKARDNLMERPNVQENTTGAVTAHDPAVVQRCDLNADALGNGPGAGEGVVSDSTL
jgi:hypothetical protein